SRLILSQYRDTGKELDETYDLIKNLEVFLGQKIKVLKGTTRTDINPFDHFIELYGNYLPSTNARWCTQKMKLEPFEKYVGNDLVVSYVGIRGDEDREGYVSSKTNIQTIFPFRKNIWSVDVINKFLNNKNIPSIVNSYKDLDFINNNDELLELIERPLSLHFSQPKKLYLLLDKSPKAFNISVFNFLKETDYPLSKEEFFPLIENEEVITINEVVDILNECGLGLPKYYSELEFEVDGEKGKYHRSRSGCFFCFYQQKIEWVWLYEQHNDLYKEAMKYEKAGYTWIQDESLEQLCKPDRMNQIKRDYLKKQRLLFKNKPQHSESKSNSLLNIIEGESEGCISCFL
ncbi:MAG: phosphoadenosine phosphosulfate reductase, partial [bacterium]